MLYVIKKLFRRHPTQIMMLSFAHFFSNLSEAIGVSLVIPVFQELLSGQESRGKIYQMIETAYTFIGVSTNFASILAGLCLVFTLRAASTLWAKRIALRISSIYLYETQTRLFRKMTSAKLSFFLSEKQGVLTNALTTEVTRTASAFVALNQWISSALTALVYILVAIGVSGWLAIISAIAGAVALSPLKLLTAKTFRMGKDFTEVNDEAHSQFIESLSGIKYIKGGALEDKTNLLMQATAKKYRETWYQIAFIANTLNIYAQPIAVIVLSGILLVGKSLNLGIAELIVFLVAFQRLLPTLSFMQGTKNDFNANYSAFEKIESLEMAADKLQERQGGASLAKFDSGIELKNITFKYLREDNLFANLNLKIRAGEMVTFLGHSGSGKSTLIDLLLGFHTPQGGTILVDNIDLNEIALRSWRGHIGYVAQDPFLFHDSIRNNIAWDKDDITEEEIITAAKQAHAHEFIENMTNGYNTIVGDRGGKLSGGQKQRLALARTLLQKPEILILDEATSALDYESESLIKDTIQNLKKNSNTTIILVAHRLTMVKESDYIYVLDKGIIVEKGRWEEMISDKNSFVSKSLSHH